MDDAGCKKNAANLKRNTVRQKEKESEAQSNLHHANCLPYKCDTVKISSSLPSSPVSFDSYPIT